MRETALAEGVARDMQRLSHPRGHCLACKHGLGKITPAGFGEARFDIDLYEDNQPTGWVARVTIKVKGPLRAGERRIRESDRRRPGHGRRSTDLPGTPSSRARELADAIEATAPDDETIQSWAAGVRELGNVS